MLRTNAIPIVDSYDRNTNNYLGSFEQTDENILNYVAGLSPFESVRLVEYTTNTLILTTIGYFFDQVSDQQWLQQILPKLIAKQTGKSTIEAVKIFFY